jgi:hypothetical protein
MDLAAAGWRELAQDVIATQPAFEMAKGFSMHWRSVRAWALPDASPQLLIMLGSGAPNAGAITDSCLIAGGPAFSSQLRAVRDWLGFGPAASWGPGGENFAIRRDSTGALTNPMTASVADQEKFQQAGEIAFIQVVGDGRASVLNYSAVRANPAP